MKKALIPLLLLCNKLFAMDFMELHKNKLHINTNTPIKNETNILIPPTATDDINFLSPIDFFSINEISDIEDTYMIFANLDKEVNDQYLTTNNRNLLDKFNTFTKNFKRSFLLSYKNSLQKTDLIAFYQKNLKPINKSGFEILQDIINNTIHYSLPFKYFYSKKKQEAQQIEYMFDEINIMLLNITNKYILHYIANLFTRFKTYQDFFNVKYVCESTKKIIRLYSIY